MDTTDSTQQGGNDALDMALLVARRAPAGVRALPLCRLSMLSIRRSLALESAFATVGQMLDRDTPDLLRIPNAGRRAVADYLGAVPALCLQAGEELDPATWAAPEAVLAAEDVGVHEEPSEISGVIDRIGPPTATRRGIEFRIEGSNRIFLATWLRDDADGRPILMAQRGDRVTFNAEPSPRGIASRAVNLINHDF